MQKPVRVAVAAVFALSVAGGAALAHSGASGIVKDRMELMKGIAEQMKQIGAMMKGEAAFDAATVRLAADTVAAHADDMPELFPEGSTDAPSEALPSIWQDWDAFSGLAAELEENAGLLSEATAGATGVDDIRAHFASMGRTCSACHEDFRKAD
jgi:cytochrome c556